MRPFWRDVRWIVIFLAAATALGLGYWGFEEHFNAVGESRSVGDTFYLSLQLFGLESGAVEAPVPWQLQVARVLAPAVAVYAAVSAIAALLRQQLQLVLLRFVNNHVVVCGLGGRGLLFARRFNSRGDRVVAIEGDGEARGIGECREEGVTVLIGDVTDRTMLRKARAGKARYVIAVGADDGVNAEVAADMPELLSARRDGALTAFVHVVDPNLCNLLRQQELASPKAGTYRLEFFSVYEIAARALVSEYLKLGREDGAATARQHVVVVGLGGMGEALVIHAARAWRAIHSQSGRTLCLTIVDQAAKRKCEVLRLRYPRLGTVCELKEEEVNIKDPDFTRAGFLKDGEGQFASVIYVCLNNDSLGLAAAQTLLPKVREHGVPVVVRMSQYAGLAALLDMEASGEGVESLRGFPLLDRTCTPELLLDGTREQLARIIHESSAPRQYDWEKLDEQVKESRRRQADRIGVLLRAVECGLEPLTDWDARLVDFSQEEVDRLVEMEREHPVKELGADSWRIDATTARNLPAFLAEAGFRVYRLREG